MEQETKEDGLIRRALSSLFDPQADIDRTEIPQRSEPLT
jgi:hypothetical protein